MFATKLLKTQGGHSLIELMITLVLFALTLTLGLPTMGAWLRDAKQSMQVNALLADLALARTESIRRGARVALCASADGLNCTASGSWHQGRIVFVDENNDAQRDSGEELLLVGGPGPSTWVFRGNAPVARYVSYHPSGRTQLTSGAFQAGTITICPLSTSTVNASQIVISATGRPRTQRSVLAQCL